MSALKMFACLGITCTCAFCVDHVGQVSEGSYKFMWQRIQADVSTSLQEILDGDCTNAIDFVKRYARDNNVGMGVMEDIVWSNIKSTKNASKSYRLGRILQDVRMENGFCCDEAGGFDVQVFYDVFGHMIKYVCDKTIASVLEFLQVMSIIYSCVMKIRDCEIQNRCEQIISECVKNSGWVKVMFIPVIKIAAEKVLDVEKECSRLRRSGCACVCGEICSMLLRVERESRSNVMQDVIGGEK